MGLNENNMIGDVHFKTIGRKIVMKYEKNCGIPSLHMRFLGPHTLSKNIARIDGLSVLSLTDSCPAGLLVGWCFFLVFSLAFRKLNLAPARPLF